MGVLRSCSSCFMAERWPGRGLRGRSDGRVAVDVLGVLRVGRMGFEGD